MGMVLPFLLLITHCYNFGVKQHPAQFAECYYNTGQVKGVKKKMINMIISDPLHVHLTGC